jgi:hypothetical protein
MPWNTQVRILLPEKIRFFPEQKEFRTSGTILVRQIREMHALSKIHMVKIQGDVKGSGLGFLCLGSRERSLGATDTAFMFSWRTAS